MLKNNILNGNTIKKIIDDLNKISDKKVYFQDYPNITETYSLPFCYKLRFEAFEKEFESWGTGISKDEATFKCFAELIERFYLLGDSPKEYTRFKSIFSKKHSVNDIQKIFL